MKCKTMLKCLLVRNIQILEQNKSSKFCKNIKFVWKIHINGKKVTNKLNRYKQIVVYKILIKSWAYIIKKIEKYKKQT